MNTMTEPSFGSRLTAAREAKGITKYRLAKLIGMSQAYVGQLETGAYKPSNETVAKLAPVLGVPLAEMQAWADADRLGEDRVKAVQAHAAPAPQMTVDEWIEAIRNLPPEEKAKARRDLEAMLRELEGQE